MTNRYHKHQFELKKGKLEVQKEFPDIIRMFDRHVGLFFRDTGIPVKINFKGMADIYALLKTKHGLIHVEIEWKTGKAVQSKAQKDWQKFIEGMGGVYVLARSSKDVIDSIRDILNEQ